MPANELKLQSGRTYRGKRPRNAMGLVNDRTILHIGATTVQYDSPSVSFGRHYPSVSHEKFLAWAERDVTEELPPGEFATTLSAFCRASIANQTLRFSHATSPAICLMVMSTRSTQRFTLDATATTRRRTSGAAMAFANQKYAT